MPITKKTFGRLSDQTEVTCYTIKHQNCEASFIDYGAAVVSLKVLDKEGKYRDVVLGCDSAADYEAQTACLGAVPGRFANRIEKGRFTLNGKEYHLAQNNGENHLHGGPTGFHRRMWNAAIEGEDSVIFSRLSPDGEEGYPGNLVVSVRYTFTQDGFLHITYRAICDSDTILNLTNHSYFNLNGHASGSVASQKLKICADRFTENDSSCLPTGRIVSLDEQEAAVMDFRSFAEIGARIEEKNIHLQNGSGYDHNYILEKNGEGTALAAQAYSEESGIHLDCYTTQPGVQLYTGNFLQSSNIHAKQGAVYHDRDGFCLETQHFPAATSYPHFPSVLLSAGTVYEEKTDYHFYTENR